MILLAYLVYSSHFHTFKLLLGDVNFDYFVLVLTGWSGYLSRWINSIRSTSSWSISSWYWILLLLLLLARLSLNLIQTSKLFFVILSNMLLDHISLISWLLMLGNLLEILLFSSLILHLNWRLSVSLSLLKTYYL